MSMVEVSQDEFFRAIGPLNVHPRAFKYHSDWLTHPNRVLVGRTEPGYLCQTKDGRYTSDKSYWLDEVLTIKSGML